MAPIYHLPATNSHLPSTNYCATVGFSAITSANVVGYANLETTTSGSKMIAPTFLTVSKSMSTLADLTVTGYDTPVYDPDMEETEGGCMGGQFVVQRLNGNGTTKDSYYWIDDDNGHKGWYADQTGAAINPGEALWIIGTGFTLVSVGQVSASDIIYKTTESGSVAVGNGTPVALTLNDLVVSGYDTPVYDPDMEETTGGCMGGQFVVQFLNTNGTTKDSYYWIDDDNGHKGWYADQTGTAIENGASSVSIPAGQGLWVVGKGLTLRIPAPAL